MFKNYCNFIGIPSIILTIISQYIEKLNNIFIGITLIAITFIGVSISFTYIAECIVSNRYLMKIKEIRLAFINYFEIPEKLLESKDTFNSKSLNVINKLTKCFPLCIINSFSLLIGLYLLNITPMIFYIMPPIILFLVQIIGYTIWQSRKSKNEDVFDKKEPE